MPKDKNLADTLDAGDGNDSVVGSAHTDSVTAGIVDGEGDDVIEVQPPSRAEHVAACEAAGLDPDEVQPGDPALTGVSRDERHDSIDPATGGLTDEATALRAQKLIDEQNAAG